MKIIINQLEKFSLLRASFSLILGIIILLNPQLVFSSIVYVLAGYLGLMGLINLYQAFSQSQKERLYRYESITGLTFLTAALFVLFFAKGIVSFLPFLFGLIVISTGLSQLKQRKQGVREVNPRYQIGVYCYAGILIVVGLLLIFNPFKSVLLLFRLFGGILVFIGLSQIIQYFLTKGSSPITKR